MPREPALRAAARRVAAVLLGLGLLTAAPAAAQRGPAAPAAQPPAPPQLSPLTPGQQQPVIGTTPILTTQQSGPDPVGTRRETRTLRQLGLRAPMQLRGVSDLQGVLFGVRGDEVVTAATLNLQGATSPALIPELSQIAITLNEQFIGAIQPDRNRPAFGPLQFPVNPVFFADNNRLNVRFSGRYAVECNDPLSGLLWSTISDTSTLSLTLERLPLTRDLARLPEPFFDQRLLREPLNLPMIMGETAGNDAVRAAVIASSWFAVQADYRGANFPVQASVPDRGNAVVIATGPDAVPGVNLPRFDGPTLALVQNPNDQFGLLLVIGGRSGAEVVTAATALAVGREALSGEAALVQTQNVPVRSAYDAPRWIRSDRPVRLGEIMDPSELQAFGYVPGPISVPFRTAPDLYTWRNRPLQADIRFRSPPGPVMDVAVSRLDVAVNDVFLRSLPLRGADPTWPWSWLSRQLGVVERTQATLGIPPWMIFGQNELQMRFDMRPLHRGDCVAVPGDVRASVDPDSTIDLSSAHRFATLPNLAHFVSAGFPFTKLADLSQTALVLPERPSAQELTAALGLVGRIAAIVGYPATGIAVARPTGLEASADRDLIVIGALGRQPALATLLRDGPVTLEGNRLTVNLSDPLGDFRAIFGGNQARQPRERVAAQLSAPGDALGLLIGFQSPLRAGRSVLALTGSTPTGMEGMLAALRDPEQLPRIQGDMALLSGGRVEGFRLGATYTVGTLPPWLWPQHYLSEQPWLILIILAVACILVVAPVYWGLRKRAALRLRARTS